MASPGHKTESPERPASEICPANSGPAYAVWSYQPGIDADSAYHKTPDAGIPIPPAKAFSIQPVRPYTGSL